MGFFTNDRPSQGSVLALARVLGFAPTGMTREIGGNIPEQKVEFSLEVRVEGWPPYQAFAKHFVPYTTLSQIGGTTFLAVWVDPQHPEKVVIDLATPPPTVTSAPTPGAPSAATILATGVPADAVIQQFSPLPMRNQQGWEMFAFSLAVMPPGMAPYMAQVGNAAPPAAYLMLFPGSRVPVRLGATAHEVVIDWDRALGGPAPIDAARPVP